MKRLLVIMASVMMLALPYSCIREEFEEIPEDIELTAKMEAEPETKTVLSSLTNGRYYPLWSAEDEIAVFADGDKTPGRFTLKTGEGTVKATFKGSSQGSSYVAWYPYDMVDSKSGNTLYVTLPATQEYVPGSFAQDAFPMIAQGGADGVLDFKNVCAILKLSLTGTAAVNTISVTAKDKSAFMSGAATVSTDYSGVPSLKMSSSGASSKVTMKCDGVQLSENTPTDFHIVIPAQTYSSCIVIEIDTYAEVVSKTVEGPVVFERSQIRTVKGWSVSVEMDEHQQRLVKEKQVLMEFYESLNGDGWTKNENWCSDKPVGEWYGVETDSDGYVTSLILYNNNLNGILTESISELVGLSYLSLYSNQITGSVSKRICELSALEHLDLAYNNLNKSIPENIGELSLLRFLDLSGNDLDNSIPASVGKLKNLTSLYLQGNRLSGQIPEELGDLTKLRTLCLYGNNLSGNVPESLAKLPLGWIYLYNNNLSGVLPSAFQNMEIWPSAWGNIVYGNDFDLSDVVIPAPDFNMEDINGNVLSSEDIYSSNKCVAFIYWSPQAVRYYESAFSSGKDEYMVEMNRLYELYNDKGFEIISYCDANEDLNEIRQIVSEYDIKYPVYFSADAENVFSHNGYSWGVSLYPFTYVPSIIAANSDKVIEYMYLSGSLSLEDYIVSKVGDVSGGGEEPDHYVSTDYSADGKVVTLQTASAGNGVKIVLLGDGYSDRQIADGTYEADMKFVYRNLFTEEPYKSLKNMFDVSYVNVVSATEGYEYGDTALEGEFGEGTYVFGNDQKCFNYALNVVSSAEMDETLIVVVMNSDAYAGTCWMYWSSDQTTDYGTGVAVAYFPKGQNEETFAQLLHHEACGHGFAKLADEYENGSTEIPASEIEESRRNMAWGWWKNVDYTSDPALVKWSEFLSDERYAGEGLGVFEGGQTYMYGVWRPTEESIMRYNVGGFNAPSREAIYYRVNKLAYGDSWEYDYETFVEFDAPSRSSSSAYGGAAPQRRRANYVERMRESLAPPVIVPHAWNEK